MNLRLEVELSKADILNEVDALKNKIDEMRPLPSDVEGKVMQKLRLDWNYNSNAIEGNKLSYRETTALLMHGITAKGKPLKDHLDIEGHNKAIEYLTKIVQDKRPFTETDIRSLHEVILVEPYQVDAETVDGIPVKRNISLGRYKTMPNHVKTITGEIHYYATPEETSAKMNDLMDWYQAATDNNEIHPAVTAALLHHKFVAIHPFDDGNGRLGRILMNLVLMSKGYPPVIIKNDKKDEYYALLSQADVGDSGPFVMYITDRLQDSLNVYDKAINGGDIDEDEDEDIDKEIALLKIQLKGGVVAKEKVSKPAIERVLSESLFPLSLNIINKLKEFEEFFFSNQYNMILNFRQNGRLLSQKSAVNNVSLNTFKSIIANQLNQIISLHLNFQLQEFKDPDNTFHIPFSLEVNFEQFYYRLIIDKEVIVAKLYHEKLTTVDNGKIVRRIIGTFKRQIAENAKS